MRLRTDLWKPGNQSAAFAALRTEFRKLLEDEDRNTLLLKGPWGCGKTSALRSILDEAKAQHLAGGGLVRTASFVSLAGVTSISDERALFLQGIEFLEKVPIGNVAKVLDYVFRSTAKIAGKEAIASAIPELAMPAITPLLKGALIIIDDVERRGKSLQMRDVLGAVIRLAETRSCKVVVIFNESELDAEDQKELERYREKVFDLEYEFSPSVRDAVTAIVGDQEALARILPVFEAVSLNNIRIVSKVQGAMRDFERELPKGRPVADRILENVVKICVFKWGRGVSVSTEMLDSSLGIEMRRRKEFSDRPRRENPLDDWIVATDFAPCEADAQILRYLESGRIESEELIAASEKEAEYEKERRLMATQGEIHKAFLSGFADIDIQLVRWGQAVLSECVEACRSWAYPFSLIWLLGQLGADIDVADYERRWATKFPLPQGDWSAQYIGGLTSDQAVKFVESRFASRDAMPEDFASLIDRFAHGSFELTPLNAPPFTDPNWLFGQLHAAQSPKIIENLKALWQRIHLPALATELSDFREALGAALDKLAGLGTTCQARVKYIRSGQIGVKYVVQGTKTQQKRPETWSRD